MNSEAIKFATYLENNNVDSFNVEELADDHNSVIFRSSFIVHGQYIPMGIIIDDTIFAIIRVNIAVRAVTDDNYFEIFNLIMRLNNKSKLFKYYLTPDLSIILDICVPYEEGHIPCELLHRLVFVAAQELETRYRDFMELLLGEDRV